MSSNQGNSSVRVTNPGDIGKSTARRISGDLSDIQSEINALRDDMKDVEKELQKIERLDQSIQQLERRIVEVETEKARAKKNAKEDVYQRLESKVEEKREKYQKKLREVLGDYKDRIDRLKDRFLNSISHRSESFEQVEEEFSKAKENKSESRTNASEIKGAATEGHDRRLKSVVGAKNEFVGSINSFLQDRRQTADLIDSVQTEVGGVGGTEKLQVPFWVVGIERNGTEELHVYPVQGIRDTNASPTDEQPYVEYLAEHPDHSYGDMAGMVKEYVQKDDVCDRLAADEGRFADPSVLKSRGTANDRFIDSLNQYELSSRDGGGTGIGGGR
jgi:hypothetical protein